MELVAIAQMGEPELSGVNFPGASLSSQNIMGTVSS